MKRTRIALHVGIACALAAVVGCGSTPDKAAKSNGTTKTEAKTSEEAHAHGNGPHGGTITDWGGGA